MEKFYRLRSIHGKIHDVLSGEKTPEQLARALEKKGYSLSLKQEKRKKRKSSSIDYPIDFVVTWVDSSDAEWRKEKEKYFGCIEEQEKHSNGSARYREWDIFQYWFRGVEKYAPWVRYVFLVTYGHVPKWLNLNHPKLKIVKHEDFIPKEYLPTFSTRCIELNLWRIHELSEHFVYFNDDVFLFNPVIKDTFFSGELPNYCALTIPRRASGKMMASDYAIFNNCGIYNSNFDLQKVMEDSPEKWFSHKYGYWKTYNKMAFTVGFLSGIYNPHLCVPLRKTSMENCNNCFQSYFHKTCLNRFRNTYDISNQVFFMWEMVHNTFEPVKKTHYGTDIVISKENMEKIKQLFVEDNLFSICLNDVDETTVPDNDFNMLHDYLLDLMETKYPQKSDFETF